LLFHSAEEHSALIDLVVLEPAVEFGEHLAGAPLSIALELDDLDGTVEAVETIDHWVEQMTLIAVELEWIDGSERLVFRDGAGGTVHFEVTSF
jgi:hypothetical protein